jgi:CheY-like chemotaxis protein
VRCLLVDDNAAFADAASALLDREGVTVVGVASTATEAIQQALALRPDVVLVDIMLGNESGFDVVRELARDGQGGGATMIMISTLSGADFEELISESAAAGFLPKSELSALEIHRILGQSG